MDNHDNYKVTNSRLIYNGSIFDLQQYTLRLPNGKEVLRDVIEHNGAAVVVAVTDSSDIVMVRQYRPGTGTMMLELPAGKLDPGENPKECALRELEEETGYRAGQITPLLKMHPVAAYCTEHISMFLAKNLQKGEARPDSDELVEVELYSLSEILQMIDNGEISDMKTILGVLYYSRITDSLIAKSLSN